MTVKELMEILSGMPEDDTVYLIQEYFHQDSTLKELSSPLRTVGSLCKNCVCLCGPSTDEIADEYC